jgi:hypothetical protein
LQSTTTGKKKGVTDFPGPIKELALDLVVVINVDNGPMPEDIGEPVDDAVHGIHLGLSPMAIFVGPPRIPSAS